MSHNICKPLLFNTLRGKESVRFFTVLPERPVTIPVAARRLIGVRLPPTARRVPVSATPMSRAAWIEWATAVVRDLSAKFTSWRDHD